MGAEQYVSDQGSAKILQLLKDEQGESSLVGVPSDVFAAPRKGRQKPSASSQKEAAPSQKAVSVQPQEEVEQLLRRALEQFISGRRASGAKASNGAGASGTFLVTDADVGRLKEAYTDKAALGRLLAEFCKVFLSSGAEIGQLAKDRMAAEFQGRVHLLLSVGGQRLGSGAAASSQSQAPGSSKRSGSSSAASLRPSATLCSVTCSKDSDPVNVSFLDREVAEARFRSLYGESPFSSEAPMLDCVGHGLLNRGVNACFMNSVLQVVLRLNRFADLMVQHHRAHGLEDTCMACQLGCQAESLRSTGRFCGDVIISYARKGNFSNVFAMRDGVYPQCDAKEFLLQAVACVADAWEEELLGSQLFTEEGKSRSMTFEAVFGVVLRSRVACSVCKSCSDKLVLKDCLELGVPRSKTVLGLQQLIDVYFEESVPEHQILCPDVARTGCAKGSGRTQVFLEKEPSVLVMQLKRAGRNNRKINTEIAFPEELSLRSGTYHLAGVLQHLSEQASTRSGHYVCTVWLGADRYVLYDDGKRPQMQSWADLTDPACRRNVYVLLYVRVRHETPGILDGTELTPYARDAASQLLSKRGEVSGSFSESLAVAASQGSDAAPRASGASSSGSLEAPVRLPGRTLKRRLSAKTSCPDVEGVAEGVVDLDSVRTRAQVTVSAAPSDAVPGKVLRRRLSEKTSCPEEAPIDETSGVQRRRLRRKVSEAEVLGAVVVPGSPGQASETGRRLEGNPAAEVSPKPRRRLARKVSEADSGVNVINTGEASGSLEASAVTITGYHVERRRSARIAARVERAASTLQAAPPGGRKQRR